MLRVLIESAIQRIKRDPTYHLDPALTDRALLQISIVRGLAFLRGQAYRIRLARCTGALFMGAHVTLRHPKMLSLGRGVILEDYVAIDALSQRGVSFGDNVTIARLATIQCTGVIRNVGIGLTIGDNSALGAYSFLGAQGGIQIGNNVIIGPRVNLHSENHRYQDLNTPIRLQGEIRQGITIDDNCWIGAGSVILDGVHIHSGCVVAAASVVTRDVPRNSVAAGVPARVIKQRGHLE